MTTPAKLPPMPDPHFGDDETMLAWATRENLPVAKNAEGEYDWQVTWDAWMQRGDGK
jgi:hypothetical protein